jgi:hypothetical protein
VSKNLGILGIVAFALLMGSTGAFAQGHDGIVSVNLPGVAEGEMYDRTTLIPKVDKGPVALPSPPSAGVPAAALGKNGPSGIFGSLMSAEPGLAMVAPRGAAMSSPKQVADRQIKRLIRRLD